jgi:hypothetical protein
VTEFRTALLSLGLVERRHSTAARIFARKHPARRPTGKSPRRIWGGNRFDLALVASALLLAVVLELSPFHQNSERKAAEESERAQIVTWKKPPAAIKTKVTREFAAPRPQKVSQHKDKYEPLRQAWGG